MVLGGDSQCRGGEGVSVPTSLLPFLAVGAGRNSTLSSPTGIVEWEKWGSVLSLLAQDVPPSVAETAGPSTR